MCASQRNAEICHPMNARQQTSQNGGMRSIRQRAGRDCLIKANASLGEAVKSGRLHLRIAVAVDVIRPQGIHGYKEYIGLGSFGRRDLSPQALSGGQKYQYESPLHQPSAYHALLARVEESISGIR